MPNPELVNALPSADGATVPALLPWQQPGPWYQALAGFLGLSQQDYFYLQSDAADWQLALRTTHGGQRCQSLTNYYSCALGPQAPITAAQWQQCLQLLIQRQPQCQRLQLDPVSADELKALRAANLPGWGLISTVISHNWRASSTDFWPQRSSQLRSTIKRKQKKLFALGASLQISPAISAELLQAYWLVYQNSWKPAEPKADFINQLLQQASAEGSLRFGLLQLNDKPIAAQIWLVGGGVAAIYKLAQDQAYDQLSPGTVLTAALADYVIKQDNVRTLDFLTGNDPYKAQWMDSCRPLYQVQAFRLKTPSAFATFLWLWLKSAIRRLRAGRMEI